eukprot:c5191_g1_i1 orf=3-188(-)
MALDQPSLACHYLVLNHDFSSVMALAQPALLCHGYIQKHENLEDLIEMEFKQIKALLQCFPS